MLLWCWLSCFIVNICIPWSLCLCSCWESFCWTGITSQWWPATSASLRTWSWWWTYWGTRAQTYNLRPSTSSRYDTQAVPWAVHVQSLANWPPCWPQTFHGITIGFLLECNCRYQCNVQSWQADPSTQVFVANPNKTQPIIDILLKNQPKLIDFLNNFQKDRMDDEQFNDEKTYLIKQIRDLKKPAS